MNSLANSKMASGISVVKQPQQSKSPSRDWVMSMTRFRKNLKGMLPYQNHTWFILEMRKYTGPVVALRLPKKVYCGGDD